MFPITTTSSPSPPLSTAQAQSTSPTSPGTSPTKFPPPARSHTLPAELVDRIGVVAGKVQQSDRTRLAPEDAIYLGSPPNRRGSDGKLNGGNGLGNGRGIVGGGSDGADESRRRGRRKERGSRSRGRKATWKKLLWVKQSYPDNYTDSETFLEHLQRNPRLQPYEFWPLVADSTVIVQQVCAVTIFICCFVAIYTERISPETIVGLGTLSTALAWIVWDRWVRREEKATRKQESERIADLPLPPSPANGLLNSAQLSAMSSVSSLVPTPAQGPNKDQPTISRTTSTPQINASNLSALPSMPRHAHSTSASSVLSSLSIDPPPRPPPPRAHSRLSTLKSALLINFTLLGLSPILKSLTLSTSSDSIWALSTLLFTINVFFFDYTDLSPPSGGSATAATGGTAFGSSTKFQASLSTNAALMASTVLASRLPSTLHVFSLTLFSIEVFGLFPVFRRHLRWQSWQGHVLLTAALVMGAGAGVGIVGSGGGWKAALVGAVGGNVCAGVGMGGASWWLIGLQRYKNEIHGPWDPARPVIRQWA